MDTKKMRAFAPLLPPPGDKVVCDCLDEIERLRAEASAGDCCKDREKEQQEAARWRHFAGSAQTALILGSDLDPNGIHDWLTECNRLADKLMSPNA